MEINKNRIEKKLNSTQKNRLLNQKSVAVVNKLIVFSFFCCSLSLFCLFTNYATDCNVALQLMMSKCRYGRRKNQIFSTFLIRYSANANIMREKTMRKDLNVFMKLSVVTDHATQAH